MAWPPRRNISSASSTARSLLPLAVGPAMSATGPEALGGLPGGFPLLIARLIADTHTLEPRRDAAIAALAAQDMPIAAAVMLDHWGDVLQLTLPHGDPAVLRRVIDEHFGL